MKLWNLLHFHLSYSVCIGGKHMPWDTCGDQRAVGRSPFLPSTTWVPGIIHGLPGLTDGVFTGWAMAWHWYVHS